MKELKELLDEILQLTKNERDTLLGMLASVSSTGQSVAGYVSEVKSANVMACPHCGSIHVVRNGHRKDGVQKYSCKDCGKHFVPMTCSVYAGTHKDLKAWASCIRCMMTGMSIRKTAEECGISSRTTFFWRHKILSSLCEMEDNVVLKGIAECDETYFRLSFKGNHKAFESGEVDRKPHKRGQAARKRGLSKEQVCVPCAVTRNRRSIARVAGLGSCSIDALGKVLKGKFSEGSTICSDQNPIYVKFAYTEGVKLVQIKGGKTSKGLYHIQHLNSYHSILKDFMRGFRGVATKYLNGYLAWHNFVNYARQSIQEKHTILKGWMVNCHSSYTQKEIVQLSMIPLSA